MVSIGAGLLLVALVSIGLTLWVTWQFEGGAAAVNEAGRMRMQAWRITSLGKPASTRPSFKRWSHSLTKKTDLAAQR